MSPLKIITAQSASLARTLAGLERELPTHRDRVIALEHELGEGGGFWGTIDRLAAERRTRPYYEDEIPDDATPLALVVRETLVIQAEIEIAAETISRCKRRITALVQARFEQERAARSPEILPLLQHANVEAHAEHER